MASPKLSIANLPPPTVIPAITEHKSTVIIAHGLGDSGDGSIAPMVKGWHEKGLFKDTKFVLPSAPELPITARGTDVTYANLTSQDQDEPDLLASRDYLLHLVGAERSAGVPSSRIIVGGYDLGGVLALVAGISAGSSPEEGACIGGVFCAAGYLPLADAVRGEDKEGGKFPHARAVGAKEGLGVLLVHGEKDPINNLEWADESAGILKELGYEVDYQVIPGHDHSLDDKVLAKIQAFISKVQAKA
ncbi:hypothetical protein VPNG_04568 [Cytospora leucostoma]|uniref:Acyl-protein thioesterase 1 n=1 Tax=Cytospora leucostoma TaxID=1230097 RepID=A0A423XC80_9PEZI|nr:hypothetical protein VPNG_04568 [Cytospora leucostoma]